ncbi:MAG: hypothetical protein WD042_15535 [Phycisphaeraceae bacterium]
MTVIELECPTCKELLELDAGFAGGVCRCSNCGTLMTVPANPAVERAESLARPDSPGGRPGSPTSRAAARPTAAQAEVVTPADTGSGLASSGTQTFVTASGKTVRLKLAHVPTAGKRKRAVIRATTVVVFVGIMLLVVVLCIVLAAVVMKAGQPQRDVLTGEIRVGVDPAHNLLTDAGFLGLPLEAGKTTILAIDASALDRQWLAPMKDYVAQALARAPSNARLQVIMLTDLGMRVWPAKPKPLATDDHEALRKFLAPIPAMGFADPVAGVAEALAASPDHLILVTGQVLEQRQIDNISLQLDKHSTTRLDIVLFGVHKPEIQKLTSDTGGQYLSMPATQFLTWHEAMKKP